MDNIKQKVKEILYKELNLQIKPEEMTDDMHLFGDGLGLDSLDAVELVVILKKHFGVNIQNNEEAKGIFVSIKTLTDYIEKETAKK